MLNKCRDCSRCVDDSENNLCLLLNIEIVDINSQHQDCPLRNLEKFFSKRKDKRTESGVYE
jgi:hypothetical protein